MIIETAIALVLIFGALVMFHELGHFLTARAVGIRVEEFAFGFGPKLIRLFKRGDTEYTIHPFPLGGFVKLAGMEPGEEHIPDGFQAQAAWKRALVIFAGPAASFILAILAFLFLGLFWGFPGGKTENRVAMVMPQTAAAKIGLRAGDRIVEINGHKITRGEEMTRVIHTSPGTDLHLVIQRNGRVIKRTAAPAYFIDYGGVGWTFYDPRVGKVNDAPDHDSTGKTQIAKGDALISLNGRRIRSGKQMIEFIRQADGRPVTAVLERDKKTFEVALNPYVTTVRFKGVEWAFADPAVVRRMKRDEPAAVALFNESLKDPSKALKAAGVGYGDGLLKVNGKLIRSGDDLADAIKNAKGSELRFIVLRDGKTATVMVRPTPLDTVETSYSKSMGLFGFRPEEALVKSSSVSAALEEGLAATGRIIGNMLAALKPANIGENVGGPILIAQQTSSMVALGPYYVIMMGGALSLSLFFVNLLPIPVLDGGHLAIILIESIRRKRLTPNQMQYASIVGLLIIGLLVVTVVLSDISKITQGLVPQ